MLKTVEDAMERAKSIGFPIMVKAGSAFGASQRTPTGEMVKLKMRAFCICFERKLRCAYLVSIAGDRIGFQVPSS